jgi:cytochrome c
MIGRAFTHLVPVGLLLVCSGAAAQDKPNDPGMMMFNNACRTCHTIREGDNRLAPNLYGIIGRKSGTARGYSNYSSSMQNADVVWDEKNLEQFIADPGAVVSGNNMKPFSGIASPEIRAKIVQFLKDCSACGPTCPAPRMCSRR